MTYPNPCSLTTLSFLVVSFFLNSEAKGQILLGPVVGGQVNWMVFDDQGDRDLYKLSPLVNFHAGVGISFRAQKRFFLHTSILYSQKGKSLKSKDNSNTQNKSKFQYIDVPILYTAEFNTKLGKDKVFKWYFGAGPTISYWLGGKGVLTHGDLNENNINPPNYDLHYKITFNKTPETVAANEMNVRESNRIQLGLNFSAGFVFEPVKNQKLLINFRYAFGQSFLSRESNGEFGLPGVLYYEDQLKIRSRELVLSLHYFIDLKIDQRKKGKSTSKIKKGKARE